MSLVTLDILGVPVTSAPMPEMIAHLNAQMGAGRRLKLAFLNAHASNLAAKDAAFRAALDGFLILTIHMNHFFKPPYGLSHTGKLTFTHFLLFEIYQLKFYISFFKITLCFFCFKAFCCSKNLNIHMYYLSSLY